MGQNINLHVVECLSFLSYCGVATMLACSSRYCNQILSDKLPTFTDSYSQFSPVVGWVPIPISHYARRLFPSDPLIPFLPIDRRFNPDFDCYCFSLLRLGRGKSRLGPLSGDCLYCFCFRRPWRGTLPSSACNEMISCPVWNDPVNSGGYPPCNCSE